MIKQELSLDQVIEIMENKTAKRKFMALISNPHFHQSLSQRESQYLNKKDRIYK